MQRGVFFTARYPLIVVDAHTLAFGKCIGTELQWKKTAEDAVDDANAKFVVGRAFVVVSYSSSSRPLVGLSSELAACDARSCRDQESQWNSTTTPTRDSFGAGRQPASGAVPVDESLSVVII